VKTIEITAAKIGRSMKKCEIRIYGLLSKRISRTRCSAQALHR
jgi:hypothetical protein